MTAASGPVSDFDRAARRTAAAVVDTYSTSFGWACRLLGPAVRDHVRAVYALVRVADEIVDDVAADLTVAERDELLTALEQEVALATKRGYSHDLVVHGFVRTARRFAIGADLIDPFFASMRTDLTVTTHDDESFARYVHGSAEVVGLMCLRIFVDGADGAYGRRAAGAARLGAAFQKVNFLRDLADDVDARGRSYFPALDPAAFDEATKDRLLDDIEADLAVAQRAVRDLPRSSRVAVQVAHDLFAELARRLRATPARTLRHRRVRVPDAVKARIVAGALAREVRR
ncbi:squalene/phytoene synthase family protein [Isoptericola halotolerans]|uniref:phytoene/squalene synthase family protein n=1 Tax=Isoptericola halotolerans TaxID=300560 RepID=UPI00388D48A8